MSVNSEQLPLLTEQRRDEIGILNQQFNKMKKELKKSREEQIDMIAAITHDLKTPLTSINGFMELLTTNDAIEEDEKKEYYQLIQKKSKQIESLLNSFSTHTNQELELETMNLKRVDAKWLF